MELSELVRFLPSLEAADFKAGEIVPAQGTEPGVFTVPYASHGAVVDEFVQAAYDHGWVLSDFDWPEWIQSAEAKSLLFGTDLARAAPEQLARLLTAVIRRDRFVEGALLEAFDSGLILNIVRRANALLDLEQES